jgi:hypothetical protein
LRFGSGRPAHARPFPNIFPEILLLQSLDYAEAEQQLFLVAILGDKSGVQLFFTASQDAKSASRRTNIPLRGLQS